MLTAEQELRAKEYAFSSMIESINDVLVGYAESQSKSIGVNQERISMMFPVGMYDENIKNIVVLGRKMNNTTAERLTPST